MDNRLVSAVRRRIRHRWWRSARGEHAHTGLRMWLDRCAQDGLARLALVEFSGELGSTDGERLLQASDGQRGVERVVSVPEQDWLSAHWPAELREGRFPGDVHGRLR